MPALPRRAPIEDDDSRISVKSVDKGVVLLSGSANSDIDLLAAISHAATVMGGRHVATEIKTPRVPKYYTVTTTKTETAEEIQSPSLNVERKAIGGKAGRLTNLQRMARIELLTKIAAPIERCFDLARSIDFHVASSSPTHETAIAGRTTGLIALGESVTWHARHLGVWQTLTTHITGFERPTYYRDEMLRGAFAAMAHDHRFVADDPMHTTMIDVFAFRSPLGPVGALFDRLYLEDYMRRFLGDRADRLRSAAESDEWRAYLPTAWR